MTELKLDRTAVRVCTFEEAEEEDRAYWHSRSMEKRLAAIGWLRELNYGRDAVSGRLQRVLEITRRA